MKKDTEASQQTVAIDPLQKALNNAYWDLLYCNGVMFLASQYGTDDPKRAKGYGRGLQSATTWATLKLLQDGMSAQDATDVAQNAALRAHEDFPNRPRYLSFPRWFRGVLEKEIKEYRKQQLGVARVKDAVEAVTDRDARMPSLANQTERRDALCRMMDVEGVGIQVLTRKRLHAIFRSVIGGDKLADIAQSASGGARKVVSSNAVGGRRDRGLSDMKKRMKRLRIHSAF